MKKLAGWGKQPVSFRLSLSFPPNWKLSLCCFNMFIAFNSLVPALLGIVLLWCKVFDIVKGGSSTLLAELTFRHTFYLVRDVHVADIPVAWLVYVRTYCVPISTLNQNKRPPLLYLGEAQIMMTRSIPSVLTPPPPPGICHLFGPGGGEFVRKPLPEAGEFVNSFRSS